MVALLLALAQPAAATPTLPTQFALTCSLIGREGRARFTIAAATIGGRRRFAIRWAGESHWTGPVTAASTPGDNSYRFVSGGTPYRLALEFDPGSGPLAANSELEIDRGLPALSVQLAKGSCHASSEAPSEIPFLPEAPEVSAETVRPRPVPLREGRVPSECTVVLRDLSELRFTLLATFDEAGIQLAVTPIAGQRWPTSPFTLRGAMLAAMLQPASGPPGGFLDVFAAAGGGRTDTAPAQLQYKLRAQSNLIESWIEVRSTSGGAGILGAGYCAVGQSADRQTGRQP